MRPGSWRLAAPLALALTGFFASDPGLAIDAYGKVTQPRPENLDLSTTVLSSGGYFSAAFSVEGDCPPMNRIHAWKLRLVARDGEPLSGAEVVIDVDMPEHLHGMTTQPHVYETAVAGEYRIDGMNFHMPGWWEITLDVSRGGGRDLARFNLLVGEGYCHP